MLAWVRRALATTIWEARQDWRRAWREQRGIPESEMDALMQAIHTDDWLLYG